MTVGLLHPAFQSSGGAEILVATWARYMKSVSVDVRVVTLTLDRDRWKDWFDGVPLQVTESPSWFERFLGRGKRLERAVPRIDARLAGCDPILASNFPANALLGASSVSARRMWFCNEPSRDFHVPLTNPRLHARVTSQASPSTDAERKYARQLAKYERVRHERDFARVVQFDLENTKKLDKIIALSVFGAENVRRVYGRESTVVHPIVRFPASRPRSRAGLDRTGLKLLTHSRLEIVKNLDTVIRAFGRILPTLPASELHVVGEGGHRNGLEKLAQELGIAGSVRFHGYLSQADLDRVYDSCDVFALLPLDEPFGMVFPEAAARGLLLVGPDHGGPFEILDGGKQGFVCDPFSPEAVAEAFLRIWSLSDSEVDARRTAADESCRTRFSEAVIGPRLLRELGVPGFDS